ncbi:MAG: 4Fe-4S dicluster domain-containing protein [Nitrospirota bacterium]
MLKEKVLDKALQFESSIRTNRSRCLRMRFNGCSCNRCIDQCRSGAISIDEGIRVRGNACTECMLCVAACPSDSFEINGLDFYSLLGKLRRIPFPILGCKARHDLLAHEKTFCMGFLSEEHLIALAAFMKAPLQMNLTKCSECGNGFVAEVLQKRLQAVNEKTSLGIFDKIRLIDDASNLDYREVSFDRRGFFRALKDLTFLHAAGLFENETTEGSGQAYSAKKIPFKRDVLNRVVNVLPGKDSRELLKACYYSASINDSCNNCFACVGMCPSGALKITTSESGPALAFSSSHCSGCGLCELFCMNAALHLMRGFTGDNPSAFKMVKRISTETKIDAETHADRNRKGIGGGEAYA